VKIGDLVRKRMPCPPLSPGAVGVVVRINEVERIDGSWDTPTVRVWWPHDYGTFWTTQESLMIVSGK
tara:strand:+ start:278 stop:478 length:201 start_codon:yes stop_codon:yes gene_type:complete